MRGKDAALVYRENPNRITPAYAGKSVFAYLCAAATEDHPRLCGEKLYIITSILVLLGSPPPMRGKVLPFCQFYAPRRITPAYAGKRLSASAFAVRIEDHPRLCGEKAFASS